MIDPSKILSEKSLDKKDPEISKLIPDWLKSSRMYLVTVTDLHGIYIYVNDLFAERFSYIQKNFIGKPSIDTIIEEDHELCIKAVQEALSSPGKSVKVPLRKHEALPGPYFSTTWEFSMLKDQEQNPVGVMCIGYDNSEEDKANKKAEIFAEKVEKIIEEIPDGFFQLDREWRFVKINQVAEATIGYSRDKLLGKVLWEVIPDQKGYLYPKKLRKALAKNISLTFEERSTKLNKWFQVVIYPSAEGLSVFFRDITKEKSFSDKIKEQDGFLKGIYNSTTECCSFLNKNFEIQYINKVGKEISFELFGKKPELGNLLTDYFFPEYKEEILQYEKLALAGESVSVEWAYNQKWWQISFFPVYGEQNELIGISFNQKDITARKEKEEQLNDNRIKLRKTIEAIPHPLITVGEDFTIQFVNDEFVKVFEYEEDEVRGKLLTQLIPDGHLDEIKNLHQNYQEKSIGARRIGEIISAITKSGKEIKIEVSLNIFFSQGKKFLILILQDVTAAKLHQDTILRQNKMLREISWNQSHELRKPVANILGICNLLTQIPDLTENEKKYLHLPSLR